MSQQVDTIHPEYREVVCRWELVRAIINNNAQELIRKPDINDPVRTKQYRQDAILTNFTNLTKVGLTGLVFRKDPKIELPPELEYLEDDMTGSGINHNQFAQKVVGDVLQTGRYGLLVDYYNDGMKAYVKPYAAESIINWKTRQVNGECVLSLVVLKEQVLDDENDIFSQETKVQYRVLFLNELDKYEQLVYNDGCELVERITPTDYNNNLFDKLPFIFIGSENNDSCIDYQPLYDMAIVNLGHYRNSADYEESIYISGQPYLVVNIGDMSKDDFDNANPNGVQMGSRKGLVVNSNGGATLLQANANQLAAQAMKEKLEQAAAIGARLIAPAGGRETAEAARIRYGSQYSALYTLGNNVEEGIEAALELACMFMGADPEMVEYELNDQYYDDTADPNLVAQQIMLLDRGVISADVIRDYGRRTGFISDGMSNEDMQNAVDLSMNPLDGMINDNAQGSNPSPSTPPNADGEDTGQDN